MTEARGTRARPLLRGVRAFAAAVLALGLAAAPLPALAAAEPNYIIVTIPAGDGTPTPRPGDTSLTNAQLRWGLNAESGGGGFAPGTCNFLSAGLAGNSGGSAAWVDGQSDAGVPLYRTQDGSVRIEKPTANGAWTVASTTNRCTDMQGNRVSTSLGSTSGNQVVIDGGTGSIRDGSLEIRWTGSFTVVYYSGMTYWSVSNPVLTLDAAGNGHLTGSASGFGADMNDTSKWERLDPREIVLAEIRGAGTGTAGGFAVTPQYLGTSVETRGGTAQVRSGSSWGAFPQSFVDFQQLTGQHSYWYSSGGSADAKKPAAPLYVSYDAAAPVEVPVAEPDGAAVATPSNPIRVAPSVSPAAVALPPLPVNAALTTQPDREGLVPGASSALSPLIPPLLGSATALGVAIVSVLSMMRVLPWQRR
jgi:hypothetical protein